MFCQVWGFGMPLALYGLLWGPSLERCPETMCYQLVMKF